MVHYTGSNHQAPDALSLQRRTGEDEKSIEDDIPVLCISPSDPQKEEARFSCMKDDDTKNDKQGVGLPEVYLLLTSTEGNDKKQRITTQDFTYEHEDDSYGL